ncbi:MAG: S9 family peptidase [Bacteroidota bacterium]
MDRKTMLRLFYSCIVVGFVVSGIGIAQQRVLTPELVLSIRTITDVQLSPDGKRIGFVVSRTRGEDEEPGAPVRNIWMMSVEGGEPWQLTFSNQIDESPRWSPDGKWIAFLSKRGESEKAQVYVIPVDGGEPLQLTKGEESVKVIQWSPDGYKIAYTVTDAKTEDEIRTEENGEDWTVADRNQKHRRLHVVDVETTTSEQVTESPLTVYDFDWSPDGTAFVLAAAETPSVDDSYMGVKLYRVSADGGEATLLVPTEGKLKRPRWSPDGKWITWLGATAMKDPYAGSVFVVPSDGGIPENLLGGYEGTADWLGWQPGKKSTIVFTAIERQSTLVHMIAIPEKKRSPLMTQHIAYRGSGPSFSRDGKRMAIGASTPYHPTEVFFGKSVDKPLKRLTHFNPQLGNVALGEQEVIRWKSVDGWEIEGVLVKPVGFQSGKRYPTVVQPHGGPESASLNGWLGRYSRWGQLLAGRGFVTLYPNYRGSIGRGVQFSMADHRDPMGLEFQDMVAGIDYLVEQGITDPERVGIGGGSYGGYTSAWAATSGSDRFKASVMWMGISNWVSMASASDIPRELAIVHWDADLYDNFELYWDRSPLAHIEKANTPTLIIHGAADPRVPIGQSLEMYTALKWRGVPVEFVTYPREEHGIQERAHRLDFMQRVLRWFEKYLKEEKKDERVM